MALTQIQVIQSLGESMSWLERELNWGVPITELRHLTGGHFCPSPEMVKSLRAAIFLGALG